MLKFSLLWNIAMPGICPNVENGMAIRAFFFPFHLENLKEADSQIISSFNPTDLKTYFSFL